MASSIDYNSSSFSICKSCGESIPKGDIRFIVDTIGAQGRRKLGFHHIECVLNSHRKKLLPLILDSVLADKDKEHLIEKLKKNNHLQVLTKEEIDKKELEEAINNISSKNIYKKAKSLVILTNNRHVPVRELVASILTDLSESNIVKLAIYATGKLNLAEQVPRLLEIFLLDINKELKLFRDKSANLKDLMYNCSWVPAGTEIKDDIIGNLLLIRPLSQEAINIIRNYYEINKNTSYIRNKLLFIEFFFKENIETAEEELLGELMTHLRGKWVSSPLEWKYSQEYTYLKELLAIVNIYRPIRFQNIIENILVKSPEDISWKILLELLKVALDYPTDNVRILVKGLYKNLKNLENYLLNIPTQSEIFYFKLFIESEIKTPLQKLIEQLRTLRSELEKILPL